MILTRVQEYQTDPFLGQNLQNIHGPFTPHFTAISIFPFCCYGRNSADQYCYPPQSSLRYETPWDHAHIVAQKAKSLRGIQVTRANLIGT